MATSFDALEKISHEAFEGEVPEGFVWIKWDFTSGEEVVNMLRDTYLNLNEPRVLQGIEIKTSVKVEVGFWEDNRQIGPPNLVVPGPTPGKVKVDPARKVAVCSVRTV